MNIKSLIKSKYVKNAIMLMGDSIIRLAISFIISIVIARIFGPEKFGRINYVLAFVSMLQVFVIFGFDEIALKDMGLETYPENSIIKTVIDLRWCLAIIAYIFGSFVFYLFIDKSLIFYYLILGLELFCFIFYIYKQWFQIKSLNKYVVLASQISFFVILVLKILYLLFFTNLYIYAFLLVFSVFIEVIVLTISFYTHKPNGNGVFDFNYAKSLVKQSFPLMLQSFATIIYMKIDQVMIGKMMTTSDVGIYSIAVTISELVYFIPMAIANAFYPKISDTKKNGQDYKFVIERIGQINVFICFVFSVFCTVFMPLLVNFVYGQSYAEAGNIIQIHCWASIFVAIGCSNSVFLIFERKQKLSFCATLIGAIINVFLNFILIKIDGGKGAAIATLLSQSFASLFFYLFIKDKQFFILRAKSFLLYKLMRNRG